MLELEHPCSHRAHVRCLQCCEFLKDCYLHVVMKSCSGVLYEVQQQYEFHKVTPWLLSAFDHVSRLADLGDFKAVNEIYAKCKCKHPQICLMLFICY